MTPNESKTYPPGVWVDADGGLHFEIPRILEHLGIPVTPETVDFFTERAKEVVREKVPRATIVSDA